MSVCESRSGLWNSDVLDFFESSIIEEKQVFHKRSVADKINDWWAKFVLILFVLFVITPGIGLPVFEFILTHFL